MAHFSIGGQICQVSYIFEKPATLAMLPNQPSIQLNYYSVQVCFRGFSMLAKILSTSTLFGVFQQLPLGFTWSFSNLNHLGDDFPNTKEAFALLTRPSRVLISVLTNYFYESIFVLNFSLQVSLGQYPKSTLASKLTIFLP